MKIAYCELDETEWHADDFYNLSSEKKKRLNKFLYCTDCQGNAWFRRRSYGNDAPHFCAHHVDDCSFSTSYQEVPEGDGNDGALATDNDGSLIIELDKKDNYKFSSVDSEQDENQSKGHKKLFNKVVRGKGIDFPSHATLKGLLHKLVNTSTLAGTKQKVIIRGAPEHFYLPEEANELFVNFKDIGMQHKDSYRLYWGFISDTGETPDGRVWLNAGERLDGASISVNTDIVNEFKEFFGVSNDLGVLDGCYAMILGKVSITSKSNKPVIWCGSLKYLVLKKYKQA